MQAKSAIHAASIVRGNLIEPEPAAVPLPNPLALQDGTLSLPGFFGWRRKQVAKPEGHGDRLFYAGQRN
jgi:hypothetical protein